MDHPRKIVIAKHGCKQFANRLWSDMSIYAYGLEIGARVVNRTAFEHIPLLKPLHEIYWRLMRSLHPRCGVWVWTNWKLLPPSRALDEKHSSCGTLYFYGWLFRNPLGLQKYRRELLQAFTPKKRVQRKVAARLPARQETAWIIGIYVRHAPYTYFEHGEFLVSAERTEEIAQEYMKENGLSKGAVSFVSFSDRDDPVAAFYTLAQCDAVIGTNSMHCNLAAWFGDIPHIVVSNDQIDWEYYRGKKTYFENKYATFAFGATVQK